MKKSIVFLFVTLLSYYAHAIDNNFLILMNERVKKIQNESVDTIIVYGFNNTFKKGFYIMYQRNGVFFRHTTSYSLKKKKISILQDSKDSLDSYRIIFDFIRNNFSNVTQQIDTIRNIEIKYKYYNGKLVTSLNSDGYYMGVSFYLSIQVGTKQYFNNLPIGTDLSHINSLYKSNYYYWILFSMLKNCMGRPG